MARKYELKRRAERQQGTRQRIVEAAVQLHRTKGPARTTLSDIARLAGVQRHTLYRHFSDEREIELACSGFFFERNPPPDPGAWQAIVDPGERLRTGLIGLYSWYEEVSDMFSCVVRDAEVDPVTREVLELRGAAPMSRIRNALGQGLGRSRRSRAALDLALDFRTWQSLVERGGLSKAEAAKTMVAAILAQR